MRTSTDLESEVSLARRVDGDIHIVPRAWDGTNESPVELVEMMCGAHCLIMLDGAIHPDDFDFYLHKHGSEQATCDRCLRAAGHR